MKLVVGLDKLIAKKVVKENERKNDEIRLSGQ